MKKYIAFLFFSVLGLSACLKADNTDYNALAKEQLARDEVVIKQFLIDSNITALRHESGLYYKIIESGTENVQFTANTKVTVKYTGRLLNGTVFDKTESGKTATFTLGGLISGWQIGIPLIQKGGKIRLIIPSGYAYGTRTAGTIPANSVLDFDIELVDVQ